MLKNKHGSFFVFVFCVGAVNRGLMMLVSRESKSFGVEHNYSRCSGALLNVGMENTDLWGERKK